MRDSEDGRMATTVMWTNPQADAASPMDVATYVLEAAKGLRRITRQSAHRDLAFLDYLLAMAEDEASKLAGRA